MTDGILLAEIQSDPMLRRYDTLIIDEAHERSLNIDFILGYVARLLPARPDLKVIIKMCIRDRVKGDDFVAGFPVAGEVEGEGRVARAAQRAPEGVEHARCVTIRQKGCLLYTSRCV